MELQLERNTKGFKINLKPQITNGVGVWAHNYITQANMNEVH